MRNRMWSMDINGASFVPVQTGSRQFRVVFDIDVSPGDAISLADIRLYNINKENVIRQGSPIIFRAGYDDASSTVFVGYVTNTFRERDGPNIITRMLCKSGDPVNDRGSANGSYGKGSKILDVLHDLSVAWPITLDIDESQFIDSPVFVSGYITEGDIPQTLNSLAYAFDFEWTVDRARLVINRNGRSRNQTPTLITDMTGMIGIPEVTRGQNGIGLFVTVRMNPYLRIAGNITVKSEFSTFNTGNLYVSELAGDASANGEYRIHAMRQRGDSHGSLWVTEIDGIRSTIPPGTVNVVVTPEPSNGTLVWGQSVTQEFRVRVRKMGKTLNIDPNWIMAIIGFETHFTFDPVSSNPGSSATGLIQFLSSTAIGLGTTTTALRRMTAVEQLEYVEQYLAPYASRIVNLGDCYMAVLNPITIGRPDSYVMWQSTGPTATQYTANANLDVNRDGSITRGEAVAGVNASMKRGESYRA